MLRIACRRKACLACADEGESFVGGEMRQCFFKRASEMKLWSLRSDAQDGFSEAKDAVGGGFEGLRGGIVRIACDDDLQ